MRRPLFALLFALAWACPALAGPTLDELMQDAAKKKEIDKGLKALDKYFKADAEQRKGGGKGNLASVMRDGKEAFLVWLAGTKESIGIDLSAQPDVVIQMMDRARIEYLETKFKRTTIEYVKVENARGMKRHEYALLVPQAYDPKKKKIPIVVSLHGRVIDPRHAAFRNAPFQERAREALWNNWFKTESAESAIFIAPTTNPDGFQFVGDTHQEDLQALFRTLGEALTDYRGDWDRVFLEVHGRALRVACEQAFVFAGIIVRDRIDDRRGPLLPPDDFYMLENLNGIPLVYVADQANWNAVGSPMSDAITAAYKKAGVPNNFIVIQATRGVDGALRGGEDKIKAFLEKTERPKAREKFTWRFCQQTQTSPLPVELTVANFNYDVNAAAKAAPMAAKAGRLVFEAKRETVDGKTINRIDIQVTETEGLKIHLFEPLLDMGLPLTITVNGVPTKPVVKEKMFQREWQRFFDEMLPLRFFMFPFMNDVELAFPSKAEFVPPAPPPGQQPPANEKPGEGDAKPAEGTPAGGTPAGDGSGAGSKPPK